ncbi:LBP / BPI / CETP family protein [Ancylostoma ceylanicum]|uniref:LBP / BPI / CETP family protein n=2 Tax=Ancylostoma ceylanicum TaxID=53326 RepID=A0A0D6M9J4_9BILA|nr:LBP / BPI / CETP family protein [Ancylostoma ceylanicum]
MTDRWLQLVVLAVGVCAVAENNSNLKARLKLSAFKFFSKTAHHVVDVEVPKIALPDITLDISGGPGKGKVSAYELKITKFHSPKFDFLLSEEGISWSSQQGAVKIKGKWEAEYTVLVPVRTSGWMNVLAADIRLNVSAKLVALDSRPQVSLGDCAVDVGHFDIEIGGGVLPWLVNLFRADVSRAIKKTIHEQACDTARSILLNNFNDFLLSLPLHLPIGQNFYIDYAVEQNPNFTSSHVEAEATAEVVYGAQSCHPAKIEKWSEAGLVPKMTVVWMSESVPNCLLSSAHEGKLVKFTVSKDIPSIAPYLRTSCSMLSICIGRFFKKLRSDYPDQYIDLNFHTYDAPFVRMREDVIRINSTFAIDFHVHPMKEHPKSLARLVLGSSSSVIPEIVANRLTGNLTDTHIDVMEDFSDIGEISQTFLNMFEKIFAMTSRVMVESILHKGVPIPVFDNVTISGELLVARPSTD